MNPFILADADRCIGCRTCEIACTIAHNAENTRTLCAQQFFPRLNVIKTSQVTVPIICRQCENAPCASACPTHAIVNSGNGVQVNQALCIGCKSCSVACPFGAIEVMVIPQTSGKTLENTYYSEAHKCDLCIRRANGPACVEVCPTHALKLINMDAISQQIIQKQQDTACNNADIHLF